MLYEKLNAEMQQTVDEFAVACQTLPWKQRGGLLACAASPFEETFASGEAALAARGFLTAVLERLEVDAVEDADHATLLSLSLNPYHQALAEEYLASHSDAWPGAELDPAPARQEWVN